MKLFWLLILLFPFFFVTVAAQDHSLEGGECKYDRFECKVKISSVKEKTSSRKTPHPIYEVKFTVISVPQPFETKADVKGRTFLLLLNNNTYPGPRYLKKYSIIVGNIFDSYCNVITRGTCTPRFFDFPDIKLDDYFESQP